MRGGNYHYASGSLYGQSSDGICWSQYLDTNVSSVYFHFNPNRLYPQDSYARGYGFNLRCLGR